MKELKGVLKLELICAVCNTKPLLLLRRPH